MIPIIVVMGIPVCCFAAMNLCSLILDVNLFLNDYGYCRYVDPEWHAPVKRTLRNFWNNYEGILI
jgi:hypothetical protein